MKKKKENEKKNNEKRMNKMKRKRIKRKEEKEEEKKRKRKRRKKISKLRPLAAGVQSSLSPKLSSLLQLMALNLEKSFMCFSGHRFSPHQGKRFFFFLLTILLLPFSIFVHRTATSFS
jgi:hypothetical protein